jgi:putative oxidoreductase
MMIQKFWEWALYPPVNGPRANLLIRLMAGSVFFWEGLMKFVFLNQGEGRFTKLGFPFPVFTAHLVGGLEIVGGILLMIGLGTRLITIPFIVEMLVAMLSTKPAIFLGTSPLPLPPAPPQIGLWAVLHEIRSEYAQLVSTLFLLITGPGPLSLDAALLSEQEGVRPGSAGSSLVRPPFGDEAAPVADRRRVSGA